MISTNFRRIYNKYYSTVKKGDREFEVYSFNSLFFAGSRGGHTLGELSAFGS